MKKLILLSFGLFSLSAFCAETNVRFKEITVPSFEVLQQRVTDAVLADFYNSTDFFKNIAGKTLSPQALKEQFSVVWQEYVKTGPISIHKYPKTYKAHIVKSFLGNDPASYALGQELNEYDPIPKTFWTNDDGWKEGAK